MCFKPDYATSLPDQNQQEEEQFTAERVFMQGDTVRLSWEESHQPDTCLVKSAQDDSPGL